MVSSPNNDGPCFKFNLIFTQSLSQRRQCHLIPSKDLSSPLEHMYCMWQKELDDCVRTHEICKVTVQIALLFSLIHWRNPKYFVPGYPKVDCTAYDARLRMQLQQEGYHCLNPGTTGQALINVLVCPKLVIFLAGDNSQDNL